MRLLLILTIALLSVVPIILHSQPLEQMSGELEDAHSWLLKWSAVEKTVGYIVNLVEHDGKIYTLRLNTNGLVYSQKSKTLIHVYDAETMEFLQSTEFKMTYNDEKAQAHSLQVINDQVYLFFTQRTLVKGKIQMFSAPIRIEQLAIDFSAVANLAKINIATSRLVIQSKDRNYFAIINPYTAANSELGAGQVFCYDSDFNLKYNFDLTGGEDLQRIRYSSSLLTNQGELMVVFKSTRMNPKTPATNCFWRCTVESMKCVNIANEENVFYNNFSIVNTPDAIVLIGSYSSVDEYWRDSEGIVFLELSSEDEATYTTTIYRYPEALLARAPGFIDSKEKRRIENLKDPARAYFVGQPNVLNWPGHGILVANRYRSPYYTAGPANSTQEKYIQAGTVVTLIGNDGNLLWTKEVKPQQRASNRKQEWMLNPADDSAFLVTSGSDEDNRFDDGMSIIQFSPEGDYNRSTLYLGPNKEKGYYVFTRLSQTTPGRLIFSCDRPLRFRVGTLVID